MKNNEENDYWQPHFANGITMSSYHIDGSNRGRETSLTYLMERCGMTEGQAYKYLDDLESRAKKKPKDKNNLLRDEFEATISKDQYVGHNGWVEEYFVDIGESRTMEAYLAKYEGKKVKMTIQEIG